MHNCLNDDFNISPQPMRKRSSNDTLDESQTGINADKKKRKKKFKPKAKRFVTQVSIATKNHWQTL